jgi:hypothetical protein
MPVTPQHLILRRHFSEEQLQMSLQTGHTHLPAAHRGSTCKHQYRQDREAGLEGTTGADASCGLVLLEQALGTKPQAPQ